MIRILIALCVALFAHGQASAEMAKAAKPAKPAKEMTVSGCTFSGPEACHYINVGKEKVTLTANAGVVIPPARTFIVATGKLEPVQITFCGVTHTFRASKIIPTKRACPPMKK
jgi:hypothetical protein